MDENNKFMVVVTGFKTGIRYYLPQDRIGSMSEHPAKGAVDAYTIIYMKPGFVGKSTTYQVKDSVRRICDKARLFTGMDRDV